MLTTGARVKHPHYGPGVVVEAGSESCLIWFRQLKDTRQIASDYTDLSVIEPGDPDGSPPTISLSEIEQALERLLDQKLDLPDPIPMATKWNDGVLVLQPGNNELQSKEIPIETFFHKIVMLRDRLRLIEQKINAHKGLSEAEKVELQQYITACYGSLTSFNVLFRETAHQFKGTSKD
ncbi:MAG TPA: hypothetical protein VG842_03505 [Sediminibacterium sp.]|nr:hypothetical protein [Sediminibacterium sp.]